MPHRRKPVSVARNFIQNGAFFDFKTRESINMVSADAVGAVVSAEFPKMSEADLAEQVFDELEIAGDSLVRGLVLSDPRGTGALR